VKNPQQGLSMQRSFLRAVAFAAASALGLAATSLYAEESVSAQRLVGTWLVEPLYFDLLVDQGLVVPHFPVLAIRPDGRFKLFRVYARCEPYDSNGREIDPADDEAKYEEACAALRAGIREDGFKHSYGQPSAQGRWELTNGNQLRFAVESTGPSPDHFRRLVESIRESYEKTRDQMRAYVRDQQTQDALDMMLVSQHARLTKFYTTFYIFDGKPEMYSVDGQFLRLTGSDPKDAIVYRAHSPAVIDAASAAVSALDVSAAQYFRCLVNSIELSRQETTAAASEIRTLTEFASQYAELQPRLERAQALKAANRTAEAARYWTEADDARLRDWNATAKAHPAFVAASRGSLAAYLGCAR